VLWVSWLAGLVYRQHDTQRRRSGRGSRVDSSLPIHDLAALEKVLGEHSGEFAAVIMEPLNFTEPAPDILRVSGTWLIATERFSFSTRSVRLSLRLGRCPETLHVVPDLACFGKAWAMVSRSPAWSAGRM